MDPRNLLNELLKASSTKDISAIIDREMAAGTLKQVPVGGRPNNRGAIEVATDPSRSLIERVTNAHDGLLELEHFKHHGSPICASPREAASAWLGVPEREGLSGLSIKARQDLATNAVLKLEPGDGSQARIVSVLDRGIGILPAQMPSTILSINESNKIDKHYLAGTYGQGGSSTLAFSKATLIVSRKFGQDQIGFTVVRYEELPADRYKTGRYVYVVHNDEVLATTATPEDFEYGTLVKHFGYDLSKYTGSFGVTSLYGALQRVLFDPVAPIRFENRVHDWNRVIKGSRNALNGAVDQGEDSRGPELDHSVPVFNVTLGDFGKIGIEYWLLKRSEEKSKVPSNAFVDSRRPVILTHNGQNQGELPVSLIRRSADLPYLRNRLICHINCDRLSPEAKRQLFASTREQSREGYLLSRIEEELVSALKADDELRRLNDLARDQSLDDHDAAAEAQMKKQVARLLRISGAALVEIGGAKTKSGNEGKEATGTGKKKVEPIVLSEPPTYIELLWEEEAAIPFYAGQRRYLRIQTDANSDYHDANDAKKSRINIAVAEHLTVFGTTPLTGGRMRLGIEAKADTTVGLVGSIRVELYRAGLSTLSSERETKIVEVPKPKEQGKGAPMPDFQLIAVDGPDDQNWDQIVEDPSDTDVTKNASNALMNAGKLHIYYSTQFPRFATEVRRLAAIDEAKSRSFKKRYELWLAVHSLLMHQDKLDRDDRVDMDDLVVQEMDRAERCRLAVITTMVAAQEVQHGASDEADAA
jgi:hypothetical protein